MLWAVLVVASISTTGFSFRFHTNCQTSCLTISQVCVCNRANRGSEVPVRAGATPRNFWAAHPQKSGVTPAQFGDFLCVTFLFLVSLISSFSRDLCASQGEEDGEDEAEVRNSYLLHLLRPNSHRAHPRKSLVGLERPTAQFGHVTVYKSGVAPAQHGAIPRPFRPFCRAQLSLAWALLVRRGEREGDGQGEQALSRTVHLPALQMAIEAHCKYSRPTPLRGLQIGKAR